MAKAAVTRSIRDDHQKNFLKIFNSLTGKHSRWEIWEDFVTLTAIEISNSTDKVNAPERTKMYQTIVSKYSAKERDGMVEMLAEVIMGMEQNPDQDFLGSLYMMCELGNDHAGQISRQEEADEVRFYWDSMFMYSKRVSPDAPPDYEAKTLYENRKDFCAGCAEYHFCRSATMVYTHSPRRNGYPWICLKRGCSK